VWPHAAVYASPPATATAATEHASWNYSSCNRACCMLLLQQSCICVRLLLQQLQQSMLHAATATEYAACNRASVAVACCSIQLPQSMQHASATELQQSMQHFVTTTAICVSSCYYICVLILRYPRSSSACMHTYIGRIHALLLPPHATPPHATIYVSSYYDILVYAICVSSCYDILYAICVSSCYLMLLYVCPHATIYVSSYYGILVYICAYSVAALLQLLLLLYMCPHATIYVSSYYDILVYICAYTHYYTCATCNCNRAATEHTSTTIYLSSCYYMCVLILLCMCPHTAMYVSSYYYMGPRTAIYVSSY
jgi:hypothetical protein